MKNLLLNNSLTDMWKEASSPLEYLLAFWVSGLAALAIGGWLVLVVNFIMNPSMFDHVTWGIYDYLP